MKLLLDTGILGQLCHPARSSHGAVLDWIDAILMSGSGDRILLPEVCDYELRRKLLHLVRKGQSTQRSIERLDELGELFDYLPLDTPTMRKAGEFWADSRSRGKPTSSSEALDGDVILAAQAALIDGTVVTTNRKHLSQFVPAYDRSEILWAYAFVCVRGPVENLAFDWVDHFVMRDNRGRSWHCRQEAKWNCREEIEDSDKLLERLLTDISDVGPMYRKLFESGYATTEPTAFQIPIFMYPLPPSKRQLFDDLIESLGESDEEARSSS